MNQQELLHQLQMEGKRWDKVKKVWKDHKGKILAGAAIGAGALAVGAAGAAGGAAYMRRKNKPQATTTPTPQPSTKPLPPIQHKTKDPRLLKKKKLIKKKPQPMNTPNRTVKVSSDYDDF